MSDTESESNTNSSSNANAGKNKPVNKPTNKPKRKVTSKVRQLAEEREKVRANLTAKLGKGARVANAAAFYKQYPKAENRESHINTFITSIRDRNAKKVANRAVAPPKVKTAKKVKNQVPPPAEALVQPAKKVTAKRGRPALPNAYKKNKSVERQAEKLVKKAEAVQKELDKVNLKLSDLCDLCKDFRPDTPKKA